MLKSEKTNIKLFTDNEIQLIDQFLKDKVTVDKRVVRADIYSALKDKIAISLEEKVWLQALSLNIKSGRLAGYKLTRGPFGGIGLADKTDDVVKESNPPSDNIQQSTPVVIQQSSTKTHSGHIIRHLWIGRKMFRVPLLMSQIRQLLVTVLECKQSESGDVVFDGVRWDCPDLGLLERLLGSFFNASIVDNCEPVLNDGSNIPVELRIPVNYPQ